MLFLMRLAQPLLWWVGLSALPCRAVGSAQLSPPSLLLNASRSITVNWQPAVAATRLGYELHLTVARRGHATFHVTKQAAAGAHSLFWGEMPEDAQCCFRVGAARPAESGEEVVYSEATCFSSCTCSAADIMPSAAPPSCLEHTLGGALLGAALVLLGYAALPRSLLRAPAQWRHASVPWPPGADSYAFWLRNALGAGF